MIRSDDFEIRFDTTPTGTKVRVRHIPTGNERTRPVMPSERAGGVRESLIAELKGLLFDPKDVRVAIGSTSGGDFVRVTHLPTGIQRTALRRERSETDLLDMVLEEVYSDAERLRRIKETGGEHK